MKKTINPSRLAQGGVMLLAALALAWLMATRAYLYYVTPRNLPYLIFAAVMLLAVGVFNFLKLREPGHVRHYAHLLALVLPLLVIGASTKALDLWQEPLFPQAERSMFNDPTVFGETYAMRTPGYTGKLLHGCDAQSRTLTIPEDETFFWLVEIYTDPTPFLGYTVRTMGQVVTASPYLAADCFSPTRLLMTCCVADVFSVGFPCQYDQLDTLAEGEWVFVSGTLAMVDLEEYQELRILADTVEKSPKPDEPYVYSY